MNCLYGVVATFVNLCNAYDKQEVIPEMVELAKFAKQHIPEEHEMDDQDFVDNRITILAQQGASWALAVLHLSFFSLFLSSFLHFFLPSISPPPPLCLNVYTGERGEFGHSKPEHTYE